MNRMEEWLLSVFIVVVAFYIGQMSGREANTAAWIDHAKREKPMVWENRAFLCYETEYAEALK